MQSNKSGWKGVTNRHFFSVFAATAKKSSDELSQSRVSSSPSTPNIIQTKTAMNNDSSFTSSQDRASSTSSSSSSKYFYTFSLLKQFLIRLNLTQSCPFPVAALLRQFLLDAKMQSSSLVAAPAAAVVTSAAACTQYSDHSIEKILGVQMSSSGSAQNNRKVCNNKGISKSSSSDSFISGNGSNIFEPECILTEDECGKLPLCLQDGMSSTSSAPPIATYFNQGALLASRSSSSNSSNSTSNSTSNSSSTSLSTSKNPFPSPTPLKSLQQMTQNLPAYLSVPEHLINEVSESKAFTSCQSTSSAQGPKNPAHQSCDGRSNIGGGNDGQKEEQPDQRNELQPALKQQQQHILEAEVAAWRSANIVQLAQTITEVPFGDWLAMLRATFGDDPTFWANFRVATAMQYQRALDEYCGRIQERIRLWQQQNQQQNQQNQNQQLNQQQNQQQNSQQNQQNHLPVHHQLLPPANLESQFNPLNILDALHRNNPLNLLNAANFRPGATFPPPLPSLQFLQQPPPPPPPPPPPFPLRQDPFRPLPVPASSTVGPLYALQSSLPNLISLQSRPSSNLESEWWRLSDAGNDSNERFSKFELSFKNSLFCTSHHIFFISTAIFVSWSSYLLVSIVIIIIIYHIGIFHDIFHFYHFY